MVNTILDLIRVQTFTTGTGAMTLGQAMPGFLDFTNVPSGSVVTYGITDGSASEVGQGTYTLSGSTGTLTRNTIYASTSSGSAINLDGNAQVYLTISAEDIASIAPIEGTWTPTDQSGAGLTLTPADCEYQALGTWVHVRGVVRYPSTTSTAYISIGGLPYTSLNFLSGAGYLSNGEPVAITGGTGTKIAAVFSAANTQVTNANLSSSYIGFAITYKHT